MVYFPSDRQLNILALYCSLPYHIHSLRLSNHPRPLRAKEVLPFRKNFFLSPSLKLSELAPPSFPPSLPAHRNASTSKNRPSAPLPFRLTHPSFLDTSIPFLDDLSDPFSQQNATSLPRFSSLQRVLSTSVSSTPLCLELLQQDTHHKSRLTLLQKEKADLKNALSRHELTVSNFGKTLEDDSIARKAMLSLLGAFARQLSDLKAEIVFLKVQNQDLMHIALPASHKQSSKRVDHFSITALDGMHGITLELELALSSWLAEEVGELGLDAETLICSWRIRNEPPCHQVVCTQHQNPVIFCRLLPFSPVLRTKLFLSSPRVPWLPQSSTWGSSWSSELRFSLHKMENGLSFLLFQTTPSFSISFNRFMFDIVSTRKRIARVTFFKPCTAVTSSLTIAS